MEKVLEVTEELNEKVVIGTELNESDLKPEIQKKNELISYYEIKFQELNIKYHKSLSENEKLTQQLLEATNIISSAKTTQPVDENMKLLNEKLRVLEREKIGVEKQKSLVEEENSILKNENQKIKEKNENYENTFF